MVKFDKVSRTDKNTRILMLYDALLNGNGVDKKVFSIEHGIDERSFDRDIEDIRLFLSESFSYEELIFDRESNTYQLTGSRPIYTDRMEATVISKILLESGLLRKDEMHGLLSTVISSVTQRDAKVILQYLSNDIEGYKSNTNVAILKFVEDLYVILHSDYDIKVTTNGEIGRHTCNVSPLEIICENQEFKLVAAEDYDLSKVIKININDIVSFENLFSIHAKTLKEKYYKTGEK